MSKLYDTHITYWDGDKTSITFCGKDTSMLIYTQIDAMDKKELMDEVYPELIYKVLHAVKYVSLVKVLSKDLYKALWESDDPRVTRWYDDSKISQIDIYKELETVKGYSEKD